MNEAWLITLMLALLAAFTAAAGEPYPRSVPLPKGEPAPAYHGEKILAGDRTPLQIHEWSPPRPARGAPVVLLVHGIGLHGKPYEAIASGFVSRNLILVAPDLRGHGASGGDRGVLADGRTLRDDLDAVVDWIGRRHAQSPVVLMGESMGGLIAADYARRAQKRLTGLVLLAPAFNIQARCLKAPATFAAFLKTGKVDIHGDEFLEPSSRDPGFVAACRDDPLAVHQVRPGYLAQLGRMGMSWPAAASELHLPIYVAVAENDKIIDNVTARRVWARAKAAKKDKVWKEWKDACHTLCWDPLTPAVIEHAAEWVLLRTKP